MWVVLISAYTLHRSLLRDNKHAAEKEQVIKLIRAIIELGTKRRDPETKNGPGVVPVSETLIRAVVAVAEHPEDPFRLICIQTLSEIRTLYLRCYSLVILY